MEPKIVKVSDSSKHVVDFKRKRPHQVSVERNGDSSLLVNLLECNFAKRRKLNICRSTGHCHKPLSKSVVRYYLNFLKSGQPGRVMYYQGGEWISFPLPLLGLIKEHFMTKNAIFEVELNGNVYLLDFLHMIKLELKSGTQQSIAWIDEAGKCFFPEIVSNDDDTDVDEAIRCCHREHGTTEEHAYENESAANEIKLQLDIDINVLEPSNFNECTGESDNLVEQDNMNKIPAKYQDLKKFDGFSAESDVNVNDTKNKQVGPESKYLDLGNIRNLFLKVMGSSDGAEIIDVNRGSSLMLLAREELFHKQVEITAKYRGDANVRYAWLPCTKDVSSSIMKYGIGAVASSYSIYGVGVHLASADCANLSVNLCDVDENGVQYLVLCRVVLGNMEVVNRGSDQFHPSSENYDTGVDDVKSPKYYVIWNMDLNSRIYPECVISFKASSNGKGCNVEQKVCDTSGVTASQGAWQKLLESASNKMATKHPGVNNVTARTPMAQKPAWMPFPILFAAISHRVSPNAMKLIMIEYDLFKKEKRSREDFVKKLRLIVGDQLLMSTIRQLQCHWVSPPMAASEVPKPQRQPNLGCPKAYK